MLILKLELIEMNVIMFISIINLIFYFNSMMVLVKISMFKIATLGYPLDNLK